MPFFQEITTTYGHHVTEEMKKYSQTLETIIKQKNRRIFLLRCKNTNTYPKFLNIKLEHITVTGTYLNNKLQNHITKFKNQVLNLTITETTKQLIELNKEKNKLIQNIQTYLPQNIFSKFTEFENKKHEKLFNKIKDKNIKKFMKLINTNNKKENPHNDWIENLSNTPIPDDIKTVLQYGPNFALPVTNTKMLPINDYIASIETSIYNKTNLEKTVIRNNVTNLISNHVNKIQNNAISSKINSTQKHILKKLNKTKEFIKLNPQIIILKPDKSNKTIIMNKTEYDNKMGTMLNDTNTYTKLKKDPTHTYQDKNNKLIKNWLENKYIDTVEYKKLLTHNAQPPKIYGLPKTHKKDTPMRPIVSSIQSPFYKLSKFLSNIIANVVGKNNHYIKDSFEFKKFIDTVKVIPNYQLISLDVVSLYTNIPKELVKTALTNKWTDIQNHTKLPLQEFLKAIEYTLSMNYLQYTDDYYKQLDGCAMGAPISSTIAQLVMEFLEEEVIAKLNFEIAFFRRYVDDCLTYVATENIAKILQAFNHFHPKLQFTLEVEKNNQINFLDVTIHKSNNKLVTSWYTKPTWSGRYLNFNSHHPNSHKNTVMIGIIDRALKLTNPEFRPNVLNRIRKTLLNNGYPLHKINQVIKNRTHKLYNEQNPKKKTNNIFVAVPYVNQLSEKLQHCLKDFDITICHKTYNPLNKLYTPLKSKTSKNKKSNVVYSIPCNNCPATYVGMTSQLLENRIKGHKYNKNITALKKHEQTNNHTFNYSDTKVLENETNYHKRIIKEMIYIKKDKNSINDRTDIQNLSQIYHKIIH